jgi:hypothetical protein
MKNNKLNAVRVWKQLEDLAVPRLHLSVFDRAVYSHLLRHSRLEGRLELRFSILWLARGACVSGFAARKAVRRLIGKGALRLAERSRAGHVVKVRLPEEIRSLGAARSQRARPSVYLAWGVRLAWASSRRRISWKRERCARRSTHAKAGAASTACAG